jgi:hypothetical protein
MSDETRTVRIVSGGTPQTTLVLVDGKPIQDVSRIVIDIDASEALSRAVLYFDAVRVDVTAEATEEAM